MTESEIQIGIRVKSLVPFSGIIEGTEGIIDEDYGTGIMIAWDLPEYLLPSGYCRYEGKPAVQTGILRDVFDKKEELHYLEVIKQ